MVINLLGKQAEVITKVKSSFKGDIIIYKEGARVVGKSYLITLIPLMTKYQDIIVIAKDFHHLFDMARHQLADYSLGYSMLVKDYFIKGDNFSIKFTSRPEKALGYNGAIVIENPSDFSSESLSYTLSSRLTKIIIESPHECGWRNPLIVKGEHVRDHKGNLIFDEVSWDYQLLNWETDSNRSNNYKDLVTVVVGDGHKVKGVIGFDKAIEGGDHTANVFVELDDEGNIVEMRRSDSGN